MGSGTSSGSNPGAGRPHPPSTHSKPRPPPPVKAKAGPLPPPKTRHGSNEKSPSPAVLKKPLGGSDLGQRSDPGQRGDSSKARVPLLPRGASKSSSSSSSHQNRTALSSTPSFTGKGGSSNHAEGGKGHNLGGGESGRIASQIRNFEKKSHNEDRPSASKEVTTSKGGNVEERIRSGSAGSRSSTSPSQSTQGSPNKTKKPLIPVKLLSEGKEGLREKRSKDSTNDGHSSHVTAATPPAKPERITGRVPPPNNHTQHIHSVSPYASLSVAMATSNQISARDDDCEYENVEVNPPPDGRGNQQATPIPSSYENIVMKSSSKPHHKPRPIPQHQPVKASLSDCYENVEFSPSPLQRHAPGLPHPPSDEHVSDDDDVLFGSEGPPGMTEVIYENFGPDAGNKYMNVDELEKHIKKKDRNGLSAEYLKIKNESLCGEYKACR